MRTFWAASVFLLVGLAGCSRHNESRSRDVHESHEDVAARNAGRAAYHLATASEIAAKHAAEHLKQDAIEAHRGWKDAQQDARDKKHDRERDSR